MSEIKLQKLPNPSSLPPNAGYSTAFSPDEVYMSVAHEVSPFIAIFKDTAQPPINFNQLVKLAANAMDAYEWTVNPAKTVISSPNTYSFLKIGDAISFKNSSSEEASRTIVGITYGSTIIELDESLPEGFGSNDFEVYGEPIEDAIQTLVSKTIDADSNTIVDLTVANLKVEALNLDLDSTLWTPADITTSLWLDAADILTISASGGLVSEWEDKSVNGRNAIQGTENKKPVFTANTITFDGVDDALTLTSSINEASINWFFIQKTSDNNSLNIAGQSGTEYSLVSQSGSTSTGVSVNFGTPTFYKNGTLVTITRRSDAYDLFNTNSRLMAEYLNANMSTWTALTIAYYPFADYSYAGEFNEIIAVAGVLTTDDRQKLEGYLAHKWGLAATLPVGHPYKLSAPRNYFIKCLKSIDMNGNKITNLFDGETFDRAANKGQLDLAIYNMVLGLSAAIQYKGGFDASAGNYVALEDASLGDFYVISNGGTIDGRIYNIADHIVFNGDVIGIPVSADIDLLKNTEFPDGTYLDAIQALINKAIDADVNNVSNIEVDNLAGGVSNTDLDAGAGTDTELASVLAVQTHVATEVEALETDIEALKVIYDIVGDDSTTDFVVNHNLGSSYPIARVIDSNNATVFAEAFVEVVLIDANNISVNFKIAPAGESVPEAGDQEKFRVIVWGTNFPT